MRQFDFWFWFGLCACFLFVAWVLSLALRSWAESVMAEKEREGDQKTDESIEV